MILGNYVITKVGDKLSISNKFSLVAYYEVTREDILQFIAVVENPKSKLLSHRLPMRWIGMSVNHSLDFEIVPMPDGGKFGCTFVPLTLAKTILAQL